MSTSPGVTYRPDTLTDFSARAGSMFCATAAILPSLIATSRTALILFLPSMTCPPLSSRSYSCANAQPAARSTINSFIGSSDVSNTVDLDQRIAGYSAGRGNRRSDGRFRTELAQKDFVHSRVVLQIVQVHVDFQH